MTVNSDMGDILGKITIDVKLSGVKHAERAIKRLGFFVRFMTWACNPLNVKVHINDSLIEADSNKEA